MQTQSKQNENACRKRVFVSGCYDMLHSGHVAFFKEASAYGDLYVGIGSDRTIEELKILYHITVINDTCFATKSANGPASGLFPYGFPK